jgi:hypothetical protein
LDQLQSILLTLALTAKQQLSKVKVFQKEFRVPEEGKEM